MKIAGSASASGSRSGYGSTPKCHGSATLIRTTFGIPAGFHITVGYVSVVKGGHRSEVTFSDVCCRKGRLRVH